MGIWILSQTKDSLVLSTNVIIAYNKTEILDLKGVCGGSENYSILGKYTNEEECKKVFLTIAKFLRDRSYNDDVFEMPLETTVK